MKGMLSSNAGSSGPIRNPNGKLDGPKGLNLGGPPRPNLGSPLKFRLMFIVSVLLYFFVILSVPEDIRSNASPRAHGSKRAVFRCPIRGGNAEKNPRGLASSNGSSKLLVSTGIFQGFPWASHWRAFRTGLSSQWKKVIMAHQVIMSRLFTTLATPVFSSP